MTTNVVDGPLDEGSVLVVDDLRFSYGEQAVLGGISFKVSPGECVAILGPSGCGKTTLLRLCADLLKPASGTVQRADIGLGYVFQEPALLSWKRVVANANFFASDDAQRTRAERLMQVAGLLEHSRKWPYQLSVGMKMRLSLVRTLAAAPGLVLLDEPFAALDQITRHRLHDEFLRLRHEQPFAALIVTHSVEEAAYLSDRILVVSDAPSTVISDVVVPFTGSRTDRLRYQPSFGEYCGSLVNLLESGAQELQ